MAGSRQVAEAVLRGDTKHARREWKRAAKEIHGVDEAVVKTGKSMGGLEAVANDVVGSFMGPAGVAVAVGLAVDGFDKLNERAQKVNPIFRNLAFSIDEARKSTMGLVDDMTIAQSANRAAALGAADTAESFAELAEIGSKLAMSQGDSAAKGVEDLTLAISRQSPMILDNLGISLKLSEAYGLYAKQLGKTVDELTEAEKKQAFTNAALAEGRKRIKELNVELDNTAARWQQTKVLVTNVSDAMFTYSNELEAVNTAEERSDIITAQLNANLKDQLLRASGVGAAWADHERVLLQVNDAQGGLNDTIREVTALAEQQIPLTERLGSAFRQAGTDISEFFNKAMDTATTRMSNAQIQFANMLLLVDAQQRQIKKMIAETSAENLKTKKNALGVEELDFTEEGFFIPKEEKKKKGKRGKKKRTDLDLVNEAGSDSFEEFGAGEKLRIELLEEERAALDANIEGRLEFDKILQAEREIEEEEHQRALERMEKEARAAEQLEKRRMEAIQLRLQSQQQAAQITSQTMDFVLAANSAFGEKNLQLEEAVQSGKMFILAGVQTAEAVADFASYNIPAGIAHVAAAATATAEGIAILTQSRRKSGPGGDARGGVSGNDGIQLGGPGGSGAAGAGGVAANGNDVPFSPYGGAFTNNSSSPTGGSGGGGVTVIVQGDVVGGSADEISTKLGHKMTDGLRRTGTVF